MRVILPFKYPCIVDSFSGVANNVGIYMNYPQYYTPLLIANHFLITYSFELGHGGYNWNYYNDDYGYSIDIREQARKKGVIETIIYSLNNNRYVRLLMDFYYIKNSPWYRDEEHLLHWMPIIIGYDEEKKVFFLCDNLFNGKYEMVEVTFDEVIMARKGHENEIMESCYFDEKIDFELSMYDLKLLLRSYIDGDCYINKNYVTYNREDIKLQHQEIFGIRVYDIMKKLVEELYVSDLAYDVKTFHVMLDHIRVCNVMMKWLKSKNQVDNANIGTLDWAIDKYDQLLENTIEIQNLYIKFSINNEKNEKESLIKKINYNKETEFNVLEKILTII